MAFDYIPGGVLFAHLRKAKQFDEERAKFYAAEILLALDFLHKKHIIYRDIKPENILLDADGHVKLTDFGLAKMLNNHKGEGTNTFCGTDEYIAPEVIKGEEYNNSVDIWGLGILLYEMLTGIPPWTNPNRKKLYEMILKSPLDLSNPNLSGNAKDLLTNMLEKNPKKRFKSMDDIKKHIFFTSVDFNQLGMKSIKPPFKPEIVKFYIIL